VCARARRVERGRGELGVREVKGEHLCVDCWFEGD
jgi:hypothetical protein